MKQLLFLLLCLPLTVFANENTISLQKAAVNLKDKASLQRGAKYFLNYCSGCHSLQYMRYNQIAEDLEIPEPLMKENLIFNGAKLSDTLHTSMRSEDAKQWFGITPPDLTLSARIRGSDWLYTYLRSFYSDPARSWGVNNTLFKDVAMPDALATLRNGQLSAQDFDKLLNDLVNFLTYTAQPEKIKREKIGYWVLLFLAVFAILVYLVKNSYWKQ